MADIVDTYRIEADTSDAVRKVEKFDKASKNSAADIEKAIKKQAEVFNKAYTSITMVLGAYQKFFAAAKEYEKTLAEQDRVVTHLDDAWDNMIGSVASGATRWGPVRGVIEDMTSDLRDMAQAVNDGDLLRFFSVAGSLAMGGSMAGAFGSEPGADQFKTTVTPRAQDEPGFETKIKSREGLEKEKQRIQKLIDIDAERREEQSRLRKDEADEYAQLMADLDQARIDQLDEDAARYADNLEKRAALLKSHAGERVEIEEWTAKREEEIAKQKAERTRAEMYNVVNYAQAASGLIQGAAEASQEGSAKAWVLFAAQAGQTIGSLLMARGAADIAMGTATSANIYTPGMGAAQIAAGGVEEAVGAGLMVAGIAGGLAGSLIPSSGGAGGGAGGAGSRAPSIGGGFGGAGAMGGDRTSNTTVIIYGEPSARLGVIVRDSVAAANRRGV